MSGHSKWSKIKHQKESTDGAKGKIFTKLANTIIIAVKTGGGVIDPNGNIKLRLAIDKAKSANMPKDKIERAIERGKGTDVSDNLEEALYEGFGPKGIGIMIETATNNKQRTVAELKNTLERSGGRLGTSGSVAHLFDFVGLIIVSKEVKSYDQILEAAINAGAIDLEDLGNTVDIYTNHGDLHKIKEVLLTGGFSVSSAELFYRPNTSVPIVDQADAQKILSLLTSLEEIEDVQKVYANFDIPDEFLR